MTLITINITLIVAIATDMTIIINIHFRSMNLRSILKYVPNVVVRLIKILKNVHIADINSINF